MNYTACNCRSRHGLAPMRPDSVVTCPNSVVIRPNSVGICPNGVILGLNSVVISPNNAVAIVAKQ